MDDEPLHRDAEPAFADEVVDAEEEPLTVEVPVAAQAEPLEPVIVVPTLAAVTPDEDEDEPGKPETDDDNEPQPAPEQVSDEDGHARLRRALLEVAPDLLVEDEPEQRSIPDALAEAYAATALPPARPSFLDQKVPETLAFSDLAADLALGRTRLVILAGLGGHEDSAAMAEELVGDALAKGLSVALVDAGSARPTEEPGLSDLTNGAASFGEVVHKSADNSFAEVPWGQLPTLDRRSSKPVTLVEALGDIYEVVVILTGPAGPGSTLPMFEELDGRVILVTASTDNVDEIEQTRERLLEAGFGLVEVASFPDERVAA